MTKNLFKVLILIGMLAVCAPSVSYANSGTAVNNEERAMQLNRRLEEIKSMDTKSLTRAEKKALRGEVKTIKKEMAAISGGVYLSVGAIILIALLLILLL